MDAEKYNRSVGLICSTCGGRSFEYDEDLSEGPVRCVGCDRQYSRKELVRENGPVIEAGVEEMKEAIISDLRTSFKKMFR